MALPWRSDGSFIGDLMVLPWYRMPWCCDGDPINGASSDGNISFVLLHGAFVVMA